METQKPPIPSNQNEDSTDDNDDLYDPNHPDADWSGFVSLRSRRKYLPGKKNQITAIDGNGYGPVSDVPTAEWTKPARKIVGHRESGMDSDSGVYNINGNKNRVRNDNGDDVDGRGSDGGGEGSAKSLTFTLIGGPIPVESPSKFAPTCWETEAQAAARRKKTELDQLTDTGRCMHVRGRKRTVASGGSDGNEKNMNSKEGRSNMGSMPKQDSIPDPADLIGFRAQSRKFSRTDPSILKDVGDKVAEMTKKINPNDLLSPAPFATEIGPTDPYAGPSGERRRDLLLENYSSVVPGYTGKRTFIG